MNTDIRTDVIKNKKIILSALWIFVMFNYLYCDVIGIMDTPILKQFINGNVGGIHISEGFLLGAAILMEIPIAMILLSCVLNYRANRWANIIAGIIMTVVQAASLLFGAALRIYYIFFSIIEILCTMVIVWYAWKWAKPESHSENSN